MLMIQEEKQKFEMKSHDLYKILNRLLLKTYSLISSNDKILKNLLKKNKIVKTNILNDDVKT